jgi:hypothetical protein
MGVTGEYYPLTASWVAHVGNTEVALLWTMKLNCLVYIHVHRSREEYIIKNTLQQVWIALLLILN